MGAIDALGNALRSISGGFPLEICCSDIEEAMQSLASIDGRAISEDIVSEIFSKFCVGK
jgi:tRNA modification GTPase